MDWYEYSVTYLNTNTNTGATGFGNTVVNYTKLRYDLEGMTTETKVNEQVQNRFMAYDDTYTQVETIMQLCQAFVIIGVVLSALLTFTLSLCFFDGLRNKFLFWIGMGTLRIVVIVTVFFILVSSIIAFLGFLGITAAFESDGGSSCNYGPCRKFMSPSSRTNAGANLDEVQEWGAREGWFLTLATIPISILLLIVVVLNKFPIPVDSVGSGEAL